MELFAITCTTCKSRLNVRDPAAIGQILSCPKCGGMVMVKPPPAFSEATEQKSDLPTATEVEGQSLRYGETPNGSAFDVLDELLSDAPPKAQRPPAPAAAGPPAPPAVPKPRFVGGPPVRRSATPPATPAGSAAPPTPPVPPSGAKLPAATVPTTAAAPPIANAPRKHRNSSDPTSPNKAPPNNLPVPNGNAASPARTNYWLLMAGSVVLGIGLALAAVCAVILLWQPGQKTTTSAAVGKNAANPSPALEPGKAVPDNNAEPQVEPSVPPTTKTDDVAAASENAKTTPNVPATVASQDSSPSIPKTVEAGDDPLGLTKAPTTSAPVMPADDPLAKFDRIIGPAGDDPLSVKPTSPPTASPPPPPADASPPRPAAPRPPPRDIDLAKCLAIQLLGIESTGTTLAEFVQTMSDLSTIPITLEVPFLPATPESPIVFKSGTTTVEKTLKDALATVKLDFVVSDNQIIVRRPEPNPFVPLAPQDVRDLTSGDEQQLNDLAELLQAVVEPGAWGDGEGQGSIAVDVAKATLVIRNRRAVQFQTLIALEKLRAARTPPLPRKTPVETTLFQVDSRLRQAGPKLLKPLSLNYSQPTRLVTILEKLGEAAGIRILVDWRDIAAAGWNPAGEGTLVTSNQPFADALETLLTPLDLTFRIIDAQTLQVVTPARMNEQAELEVYRVKNLLGNDVAAGELLAKLRTAMGEDTFVAGGGNGELRYDPTGQCLLAWLPQPRQRELEAILVKLQEK